MAGAEELPERSSELSEEDRVSQAALDLTAGSSQCVVNGCPSGARSSELCSGYQFIINFRRGRPVYFTCYSLPLLYRIFEHDKTIKSIIFYLRLKEKNDKDETEVSSVFEGRLGSNGDLKGSFDIYPTDFGHSYMKVYAHVGDSISIDREKTRVSRCYCGCRSPDENFSISGPLPWRLRDGCELWERFLWILKVGDVSGRFTKSFGKGAGAARLDDDVS